jgi:tetratricopeptide (TPR) repeat protein
MQSRMRESARQHPELSEGYHEFFEHYAQRLGIEKEWNEEVSSAWADGSGDDAAGILMLRRDCARSDFEAARQTCQRLLARADGSDAMVEKLATFAQQARRPDLQLLVAETKARRSWPLADGMFDWVRLLDAGGLRERAKEVLSQHAWLASQAGGAEALGRAWLSVGDAAQARSYLAIAMKENAGGPSPSVLAAMARAHLPGRNFKAAKLLLKRAFGSPVCHEYDALVEYLEAAGDLARWRELAEDFGLKARSVHELQRAIFAAHEKAGRVKEALALLAETPGLVRPLEGFRIEDAAAPPIDCQRVRRLASTTGAFPEVATALERMAASGIPDAAPELASLQATRAEKAGEREQALRHLERAAVMRPTSWDFARRIAELRLGLQEPEKSRDAIERFLSVSPVALEREAAFDLWEKANAGAPVRRAGS